MSTKTENRLLKSLTCSAERLFHNSNIEFGRTIYGCLKSTNELDCKLGIMKAVQSVKRAFLRMEIIPLETLSVNGSYESLGHLSEPPLVPGLKISEPRSRISH